MDDRLNEVLERLGALERRLDALERKGAHEAESESAPVECGFLREEHRIVDLIVRRVTESVERRMEDQMAQERSLAHPPPDRWREPPPPTYHHEPPPPPPPDRGSRDGRGGHEPRRQHPRRGGG